MPLFLEYPDTDQDPNTRWNAPPVAYRAKLGLGGFVNWGANSPSQITSAEPLISNSSTTYYINTAREEKQTEEGLTAEMLLFWGCYESN
jgi:hypothetical protein